MASDDEYELYDYDYDDDDDGEAMEEEEYDDEGHLGDSDDEPVARQEPPVKCSAITKEALSNAQQEDLSMVMSLFNIKQHQARAVLIRYRWNKEVIIDHMERKGQDVMLREAGVVLPEGGGGGEGEDSSAGSRRRKVTCGVCFDDFSRTEVSTMDCGHSFCNECWTGYLVASLDSGKKQIRCMSFKCPAVCDEAVVQRLLGRTHPAAAARFLDFLLQSYVDDNTAVRWCPGVPHCGRAVRVSADASEAPLCEVECPCGHGFCFRCGARAHSPCPCAMWARWEAKCLGEAENVKWLIANTKNCPKCLKPILKDGGCNHVTCKCGQSLCWLCGAATGRNHDYTRIVGHSCNRFDPKEVKKVSDARREFRRYEHYFKRFQAHDMSYRTERDKLGADLAEQVRKLEARDSVLVKAAAQSLADAHRSLLGCRQALSRSFVFAYYMFDVRTRRQQPARTSTAAGSGTMSLAQVQGLFENYQEDVERQVELLSKRLEATTKLEPEKEEEVLKAKQSALDVAVTIEKHCDKMYACIQDELLPMLAEPMVIAAFQKNGPTKAADESPAT